jgi:hypothetical protein
MECVEWDGEVALLEYRPHKLEAGVVSFVGRVLVVVGFAGDQVINQTVDGIRNSGVPVAGHGCILPVVARVPRPGVED